MTPQTFSLEMCRLLSSLAPGFEGHWNYIKWKDGIILACWDKMVEMSAYPERLIICPAWQVEDVLMNLSKIFTPNPTIITREGLHISKMLILWPGSAYQKIEEYLWTIFK